MRVLPDTSTFIWWADAGERLGKQAVAPIEWPGTEAYVSAVSGWEIAIKWNLGKLRADSDVSLWMVNGVFEELPVTLDHGLAAGDLPLVHRDPFDQLLVAQAQMEGLTPVTADREMQRYEVPLIDARAWRPGRRPAGHRRSPPRRRQG